MEASNHMTDELIVRVSSSHRRFRYASMACAVFVVAWGLFFQAHNVSQLQDHVFWSLVAPSEDSSRDSFQELVVAHDQYDGASSCSWSPSNEAPDCFAPLLRHLQASLNASRTQFWQSGGRSKGGGDDVPRRRYLNRRWLFLGDSTVFRLFLIRRLEQYLLHEAIGHYEQQRGPCHSSHRLRCSSVYCQRCDSIQKLSLNKATSGWILPDFDRGEGPMKFGYTHPYCTDCDGCDTKLLTCSLWKNDDAPCSDVTAATTSDASSFYTGPAYGGYLSVEFARDVELQTDQYKTTQENLLSVYIAEQWNAPIELIEEFGRPICVVSTGHHDIAIPNVTKAIYVENVQWYLEIVSQQCDYILWLTNTSPLTDDFAQTMARTLEWNMAVQDILFANPAYRRKSFVLDVFNASIEYPHADNLHMEQEWYDTLANFLRTVMDADLGGHESY